MTAPPIRRGLAGLLMAATLFAGLAANAAEVLPFRPEAFAAAQQAGKPILVHIAAPWCAICNTQKVVLGKLEDEPRFKDLTVFVVDFDTQKSAVRQLGARMQSTLITYKGGTETGRSVGETQAEWIEAAVEKAL